MNMTLTGFIAIQYWVILFLMAGLFCSRRYNSRWVIGVLVLAIGRFFIRAVVYQLEGLGDTDHVLSATIANEWLVMGINFIVIGTLLSEMVTGTKCWRIYKLERRIERRKRERDRDKDRQNVRPDTSGHAIRHNH